MALLTFGICCRRAEPSFRHFLVHMMWMKCLQLSRPGGASVTWLTHLSKISSLFKSPVRFFVNPTPIDPVVVELHASLYRGLGGTGSVWLLLRMPDISVDVHRRIFVREGMEIALHDCGEVLKGRVLGSYMLDRHWVVYAVEPMSLDSEGRVFLAVPYDWARIRFLSSVRGLFLPFSIKYTLPTLEVAIASRLAPEYREDVRIVLTDVIEFSDRTDNYQ